MTAPRPDGEQAARAITRALLEAALPAEAVDYVNAHASSTVLNDTIECQAIRRALGPHADAIAVSGTKGLHGHALGASGAIEIAICSLALQHGLIPGNANLLHPDPACDLDLVPDTGRTSDIAVLVKNSFGFGGINACVVLSAAR